MKCPKCDGTGELPDDRKIGAEMRNLRKRSGFTLREFATLLGFSANYLCDLELGRRHWHSGVIARYKAHGKEQP